MKKLFSALILCTAILCGCSAKGGEEISETSALETSFSDVKTESSVTTVTEAETTTTATTSAEPAEEEIIQAVQLTSLQGHDIGGGYVCYISDDDKILYVAKDNVITDSINLNGMYFDPDWQINFYDMDTPPCFALEVGSFVSENNQAYYFIGSIYYHTYFVIDGKITEMNWTLDGEPLDTVDYTMLKCRGSRHAVCYLYYKIICIS